MIGKISRGGRVLGLLRYLFGPGEANEHVDPHLVAAWADPGLIGAAGPEDVGALADLLNQPVTMMRRPVDRPVWHASLRSAPEDRRLSDAEWAQIAEGVVTRMGFISGSGDPSGCRWAAVRHADDHIHLVVTLARMDGRRPSVHNDFTRLRTACQQIERRYGLRMTASRDNTAPVAASRPEQEKAARRGQPEPSRVRLLRTVRTAAAGAGDESAFFARLEQAGLLVRRRHSTRHPGEITGYALALPGDRDRQGVSVWYSGGRLAADLSLPQLRRRWQAPTRPVGTTDSADRQRLRDPAARRQAVATATAAAVSAAEHLAADVAGEQDQEAVAHAAGDLAAAVAHVLHGPDNGSIHTASERIARAARARWAATPHTTPAAETIRAGARILLTLGRAGPSEATDFARLVEALLRLAEALARLRAVQQRHVQADAAVTAARMLAAHQISHQPPASSQAVPTGVHSPARLPLPASPHRRRGR
ncbi:relaxase/mobilization nuclease domain-containing protein [Protofrankia symbiont of Coriaria ruscifolia]|uniref:relaxase/mobilization nuclease domain-containing protein n=1 Tax=Protofrankia symbiont of Coriaria ruscifolia TaxID=1306542 RepID=UPI0010413A64|nr:relaxase [Protofrankia symbiont of Coriaria ruscifolia]